MQDLVDILKEISQSINKNHTELIMSKAMEIEKINTTYYHGEIDNLEEQPLDFINLNIIKIIAEYLIRNYDNTITNWVEKEGGARRYGYERKQSIFK
jgi:hypothetical protein